MGNLGGGEILVILLVALMVLGPTKLPDAARQVGRAARELRRMSGSFQRELREAIHDPIAETKAMIKGADSTASGSSASAKPAEPDTSAPFETSESAPDADPPSEPDSSEA